jgi:hypothetical protein
MGYKKLIVCDGCGREIDIVEDHVKVHGWFNIVVMIDKCCPAPPVPDVSAYACSLECIVEAGKKLLEEEKTKGLPRYSAAKGEKSAAEHSAESKTGQYL